MSTAFESFNINFFRSTCSMCCEHGWPLRWMKSLSDLTEMSATFSVARGAFLLLIEEAVGVSKYVGLGAIDSRMLHHPFSEHDSSLK